MPTALHLHHNIVNCCPEEWASSYYQAFSGAVTSSRMSFLASMSNV